MPEDITFTLGWADIDTNLLPPSSREAGTDVFRSSVIEFLQKQYEPYGGKTQIIFNDARQTLTVHWSKRTAVTTLEQEAIGFLNRQEYGKAIPLFKALVAANPKDSDHLLHLGIIYRNQGRFAESIDLLNQALALDNSNTVVHQALGESQLKLGDFDKAADHFRLSLETDPSNLLSRLGLAQSLESLERFPEADELYSSIITSDGHTEEGWLAKEGRTRIAHSLLRRSGNERPDVVMYCLGALERFASMTPKQIEELAKEIAILGMRGLDINDPEPKYSLQSWTGEFSGLHLVTIMYAAFRQTVPDMDAGIDFSKEYAKALEMLEDR